MMKRIGLIVFAVVVVAIAAPVVLIATLPTAKVTIHAIRPTGEFVTGTNKHGQVVSGPVWLFGITNLGRVNASWYAGVYCSPLYDRYQALSAAVGHEPSGMLRPGEGLVTNMT